MTLEQFKNDDRTLFAVLRALEIMGEAAKRVPEPVRKDHPMIPWASMASMRDKLNHDSFGVNEVVVWKTIADDLPPIASYFQQLLRDRMP